MSTWKIGGLGAAEADLAPVTAAEAVAFAVGSVAWPQLSVGGIRLWMHRRSAGGR
jgi:hypothetical protein